MKKFLPYLFLFLIVASCKKVEDFNPTSEKISKDVQYGASALQKMDVFLPANRNSNTKVILLVHGGYFIAGDKSDFEQQSKDLMAKGYAVFNMNYRLVNISPISPFTPSPIKIPEQLADIKLAIDFIAGNVSEYVISASKWGITGHSAGGTLALLHAYGDKNSDGRIKVVGNWAGVTDLSFQSDAEVKQLDLLAQVLLFQIVGKDPVMANQSAFFAVSPIKVATQRGGIATLNIRPEFNVIDYFPDNSKTQYAELTAALTAKGTPTKYIEIPKVNHNFNDIWKPVLDETIAYFDAILN